MERTDDTAFDLLVRGLIVDTRSTRRGTLAIRDGIVVATGSADWSPACAEELDAGDALILPGAVDVHVHTSSTSEEGMSHATRAAAAGGVTTLCDMPYDVGRLVADRATFAEKVAEVQRESHVDVALWATVPPRGPLDEVAGLVRDGACAFKLSTFNTDSERFPRIPDDQVRAAFGAIAAAGGLAGIHSENDEIVQSEIASLRAAGRRDALAHAESRPAVAETEAIGRVLELALATGVSIHLCHVTVERGVELARRAAHDGVDVSLETCPHYLLLDVSELERQGGLAKINPPLREATQPRALWRALGEGRIDIVASDHVGWPLERKVGPDIFDLASGAPGVELILPLLLDDCLKRGLGAELAVRALCEAPARRFGLWPRKGHLGVGADADLVVVEQGAGHTIDPAELETGAGWSPYAGRALGVRVIRVLSRGRTIFDGARVIAQPGDGSFVASSAVARAAGAPAHA